MRKDLDLLIKKAFKIRYEETEYPPSQEVWENVIKIIRKQRKRDMLRRLKPAIAACVLLAVITSTIIGFNVPVGAFADKIIKSIEEFAGNTFVIRKSVDTTAQNGQKEVNDSIQDPRINDAQNKVSFKLLIPKYVSDNYELTKVDISNEVKEQEAVTFVYYNSKNAGDKSKFILITQKCIPKGTKSTLNVKTEKDTQIKHLKIRGMDATLINYDNALNKILWDIDNKSYKIDGTIDEKSIIKVAESME
ncbi:MAG TPA: DUF4367 domain-containing protein [Ruminiclostridium sp.]